MRKLVLALLAVVFVAAAPALAGTKAGDMEASFSGAVTMVQPSGGEGSTQAVVATTLGYFITDAAAVNANVVGMWSDEKVAAVGNLINLKWHFNTAGQIVPYAGPQVGIFYWNDDGNDSTEFAWGALAGVKIFVSENVNVFVEANFQRVELSPDALDIYAALFGIGFLF